MSGHTAPPKIRTPDECIPYAQVYLAADLTSFIRSELGSEKKPCIKRGVCDRIHARLMSLKGLSDLEAAARDEMCCSESNMKSLVKAVWYASSIDPKADPLLLPCEKIPNNVRRILVTQTDFNMTSRGFELMGRLMRQRTQPYCKDTATANIYHNSNLVIIQTFNPLSSVSIKSLKDACVKPVKANGDKKGEKRGAALASQRMTMHVLYIFIMRTLLTLGDRDLDEKCLESRQILRAAMTMIALAIQMVAPHRGVEVCSFSWMDLKEFLAIRRTPQDNYVVHQVPFLVRCMMGDQHQLPGSSVYMLYHYCAKLRSQFASSLQHTLPIEASLLSLPFIFTFATKIILHIEPKALLMPKCNPMTLMLFKVPTNAMVIQKAVMLPTDTLDGWMNNHLPPGAIKDSWLTTYSSRVAIARLVVHFGFLDSPNRVIVQFFKHLFGHSEFSNQIIAYALHRKLTRATTRDTRF